MLRPCVLGIFVVSVYLLNSLMSDWRLVAAGGKVTARKTDPSEHSVTSVVSDVKAESLQVPLFGEYCCVERHVTEMFVTLLT